MAKTTAVTINAADKNGEYRDVLAAADAMAAKYGSATNAIAVMVRGSYDFRRWEAQQESAQRK